MRERTVVLVTQELECLAVSHANGLETKAVFGRLCPRDRGGAVLQSTRFKRLHVGVSLRIDRAVGGCVPVTSPRYVGTLPK